MNDFATFYFDWLGNIGGWFIFFLFALILAAWIIFDADVRRLDAGIWKTIAIISLLFIAAGFVIDLIDDLDRQFTTVNWAAGTVFASLGLLSVFAIFGVGISYFITFSGKRGCARHGAYSITAAGGKCPACIQEVQHFSHNTGISEDMTSLQPAPQTLASAVAYLVDVKSGQRYAVRPGQNGIGRSQNGNNIIVTDHYISRRHAQLWASPRNFVVQDMGSRGGTFVNGRAIGNQTVALRENDEIQLGQTVRLRLMRP